MREREQLTRLSRQGRFLRQLALLEKAQSTSLVASVRFADGDDIVLILPDLRTVTTSIDAQGEDLARALSVEGHLLAPALRELPAQLPEQESMEEFWGEALWDCGSYVDHADDFMAGDMRFDVIERGPHSVTVGALGRGARVTTTVNLGVESFPMALPIDLATEIINATSSSPTASNPTRRNWPFGLPKTFGRFDTK